MDIVSPDFLPIAGPDLAVAGEAVFEDVIGDHKSGTRGKLALCASA
jgi:hypothetical protein